PSTPNPPKKQLTREKADLVQTRLLFSANHQTQRSKPKKFTTDNPTLTPLPRTGLALFENLFYLRQIALKPVNVTLRKCFIEQLCHLP
ncbi:MAG: hypothetical protein ACYTBJ_21430, partial [Planctomycetota bacterium]